MSKAEAAGTKKEVSGSSERLHSDRQAFRRGTLGPQEQRDNPKRLVNRKATCFTLLKRITRLKCVNSVFKSVDTHPKQVASIGPMAPCRSHHRNHTR